MYLGAHVRRAGGVWKAIEEGERLGCEAIQFFAGSPRTWKPQTLQGEGRGALPRGARRVGDPLRRHPHDLPDQPRHLADDDFYEKSVAALVGAVTAAEQLGADAIVTHVGSHGGDGFDAGLARVQRALRAALDEVGDSGVRVLLENTAGAGGTMGVNFAELAAMIDSVDGDPRVGAVPRHGASLRGRLRPAHARTASTRRSRRSTRPAASTVSSAAPQRLEDAARLQPRPAREHRRRRAGPAGLRASSSTTRRSPICPGIIEVPGVDGDGPDRDNVARLLAMRHASG